jgi:hypothetical protein
VNRLDTPEPDRTVRAKDSDPWLTPDLGTLVFTSDRSGARVLHRDALTGARLTRSMNAHVFMTITAGCPVQ